jgi:transposase
VSYDRHELKIIRRGVSPQKVISAYKYFASLRKAAKACNISKDTVVAVLKRYGIPQKKITRLPQKASYNPRKLYSAFALWHKVHAKDKNLPNSVSEIAKLAGVSADTVKCYFYRRRKAAAALLQSLPNLRDLDLTLEDIEGNDFQTKSLTEYRYVIDKYSERAAMQGKVFIEGTTAFEVTAIIPSIEQFVSRVRAIATSASA